MLTKLSSKAIWPGHFAGPSFIVLNEICKPKGSTSPVSTLPLRTAMLYSKHPLSQYLKTIHLKVYHIISLPRASTSYFGPALRIEDLCMVTIFRQFAKIILKESHNHLFNFTNIPEDLKVDSFLCCHRAGMWYMLLPSVANGIVTETRMLLLETNELPLIVSVRFHVDHEIIGKWLLVQSEK